MGTLPLVIVMILYICIGLITAAIAMKIDNDVKSIKDIQGELVFGISLFWPLILMVATFIVVYRILFVDFLLKFVLKIPENKPSVVRGKNIELPTLEKELEKLDL